MKLDLYALLGLTPSATEAEIKAAGKRLQKLTHPDKPDGDPEKFRQVTKALTVLRDPRKRERYDATGDEESISEETEEQMMAWALLAQQFSVILNGEQPLGQTDVPKQMRKALSQGAQNGAQEIARVQKKIARAADMRRRLKVPEGAANRLDDVISGHEREAQQLMANIQKQLRVGKLAEEMLEGYLWTLDEAPTTASPEEMIRRMAHGRFEQIERDLFKGMFTSGT